MSDTKKNKVKEVETKEMEANANLEATSEDSKKDFGKKALRVTGDCGIITLSVFGLMWLGEHVVNPLRKKWFGKEEAVEPEVKEEVTSEE